MAAKAEDAGHGLYDLRDRKQMRTLHQLRCHYHGQDAYRTGTYRG